MKVAFFQPHLCLRGTTVAMYDYAYYNEKILGNESIVIYVATDYRNHPTTIKKFKDNLHCVGIETIDDLDQALIDNQCDAVYITKGGYKNDGVMATACKTLIQAIAMAPEAEAHGDVYSYGSHWLSQACSGGRLPAVPYMVDLPNVDEDMREELGIPADAIVFGRSGGDDTWNLSFASHVVEAVLRENTKPDIYFLFQNTPKFLDHERVIHLDPTSDMKAKTMFINTCDAMLHARHEGESFGLSCGEFSIRNKPVITWFGSPERNHIETLGDKGIYYNTPQDLFHVLLDFKKQPEKDWNAYREHTPEKIMNIFEEVYLK